ALSPGDFRDPHRPLARSRHAPRRLGAGADPPAHAAGHARPRAAAGAHGADARHRGRGRAHPPDRGGGVGRAGGGGHPAAGGLWDAPHAQRHRVADARHRRGAAVALRRVPAHLAAVRRLPGGEVRERGDPRQPAEPHPHAHQRGERGRHPARADRCQPLHADHRALRLARERRDGRHQRRARGQRRRLRDGGGAGGGARPHAAPLRREHRVRGAGRGRAGAAGGRDPGAPRRRQRVADHGGAQQRHHRQHARPDRRVGQHHGARLRARHPPHRLAGRAAPLPVQRRRAGHPFAPARALRGPGRGPVHQRPGHPHDLPPGPLRPRRRPDSVLPGGLPGRAPHRDVRGLHAPAPERARGERHPLRRHAGPGGLSLRRQDDVAERRRAGLAGLGPGRAGLGDRGWRGVAQHGAALEGGGRAGPGRLQGVLARPHGGQLDALALRGQRHRGHPGERHHRQLLLRRGGGGPRGAREHRRLPGSRAV
ncbi:MAG: Leucine aminopeptidase-related protein, partial [uncultured Gemmatimonadetes bacterium]